MPRDRQPPYADPLVREGFDAAARAMQRRHWDLQAEGWDAERAADGLQPRHVAALRPWLGGPALLVGAGRGSVLLALRRAGHEAEGVDWSEPMVAAAERDGVAGLALGDAAALPHPDAGLATVILATGVLLPTLSPERRERYLGEAARVLAPGGRLVLALFFAAGSLPARWAAENAAAPIHTLGALVFWDLAPLAAALGRHGFGTLARVDDGPVLLWVLRKGAAPCPPTSPRASSRSCRP